MPEYTVWWTEQAIELTNAIGDRRIRAKLWGAADSLREHPHEKGRPLRDELTGFRSLHWSRYRIIYEIDEATRQVRIAVVGMRSEGKERDVYETARRLLAQGLIDSPESHA